ncbi:GntR family transcriptional regulator [Humitalea sp. 24SJ18S-53]|uniref:GntR family transcriptional regulator n=1 Tax=Humitalea sp. 24SJ18S-53 TaxID=3422307 RepID=UPI003D673CBC
MAPRPTADGQDVPPLGAATRGAATMATRIHAALREALIHGAIPPGARLHTRDIGKRYATGLSPVREALSRLSTEGLVRQSDQRGFTAAPLSLADLDELTRTRCWLNEAALREAIHRGDAAWEERVALAFFRLSRQPRFLGDADAVRNPAWDDAHRDFHRSLIAGCDSHWMDGFCDQLFDAFERYRNLTPFNRVTRPNHLDEHRAIMEAAIARDGETAARLLRTHFERSETLVRQHMASTQHEIRPDA